MSTSSASYYPIDPLRLPNTDWLRHDMVVTGPSDAVLAFKQKAAGKGVIPWAPQDLHHEEEDRLQALLHPPDGTVGMPLASARVLARLLRDARDASQHRISGLNLSACPFDLHALIPVPISILRQGPDDAASVAWLRQHWGVVQALRHVRLYDEINDGRQKRVAKLRYAFWSADWSPWAAVKQIRRDNPALAIDLRPDYQNG